MTSIVVNEKTYEVKKKIYDTATGSIFLVSKDEEEFVIKKLDNKTSFSTSIKELYMYQNMTHSNVISLVDFCYEQNFLVFVFPKFDIDLFDFNHGRRFSEMEKVKYAKTIFLQIGKALQYLHSQSIYHGDISLENIFLKDTSDPEKVKAVIGDFGLSDFYEKDKKINSSFGKLCCINRENFYRNHNPFKSDVWEFCISIYMFFTGHGLYESPCTADENYNLLMEHGFKKMCKLKRYILSSLIDLFEIVFVKEDKIPDIETVLQNSFFSS